MVIHYGCPGFIGPRLHSIGPINRVSGAEVVGFTSARIKTLDKLTFKYARVEARIKAPNLECGLWPAFWTRART